MPRFAAQLSAYCHLLGRFPNLLIRQHLFLVKVLQELTCEWVLFGLPPTYIHNLLSHSVPSVLQLRSHGARKRTYAHMHARIYERQNRVRFGTTTPKPDKPTFHVTRTPLLRDFLFSDSPSPCFVLSRAPQTKKNTNLFFLGSLLSPMKVYHRKLRP